MNRRLICCVTIGVALLGGALYSSRSTGQGEGQPAKANDAASKAILANVQRYVEAFNKHDAKGILALFDENCRITELDGTEVRGLKQLADELKETFEEERSTKISCDVDEIAMITPQVAVETGKVTYFADGKTATSEAQYEVTHVLTGSRWLMKQVRVFSRTVLHPYDRLRDLEWLVGDWVDEGEGSLVETSYRWNANKTFLLNEFKVKANGQETLSGTQRIGWDPLTKQIRSWVFDSEGGYGDGLWSEVDDTWVIKARGVRSDGKVVTMTNQITQEGKDRYRLESVDRIAGEERMPSFTAIAVRRPPAAKN